MSSASPARPFPRRPAAAGFTLVEMIITLTVFVLLSAMIFGIISGVLKGAGTLQENQNRGDQTMALKAFLKKQLTGLPGQSLLVSYRRGDGEGLDQNGIIFGTNGFLTAIDAHIQPNGLYTLRVATFSPEQQGVDAPDLFEREITGDDASLSWTPLIHDLQRIDWKFQDVNATQWVDQWDNTTTKPNLVEFSLQIAGDLQPAVMDFWIPPIYVPPALALPGPATPTANGTSTAAPLNAP